MKYITGIHALNIPCTLDTTGDWHSSALKWENIKMADTEDSIFGEYGIEMDKKVPKMEDRYPVANHIRALLDMLSYGDFSNAQGMNRDYICNPVYNKEIFVKVMLLKNNNNWKQIDEFMGKEYKMKWLNYKEKVNG